jgi:hypothetical protein
MNRSGFVSAILFAVATSGPAYATNKLRIERVEPDYLRETLFIHGQSFGTSEPAVHLDDIELEILYFDDELIETVLPDVRGTLRLFVERPGPGKAAIRADLMDLTLGAVGPRGEDGAEGPPGPIGPPGLDGVDGIDGADGLAGMACRGNGRASRIPSRAASWHCSPEQGRSSTSTWKRAQANLGDSSMSSTSARSSAGTCSRNSTKRSLGPSANRCSSAF